MAHLAIFQPDARVEARLGDALSGIHRVSLASSWPELRRLLAREALDGCIVDGDFPNREAAVTEMRRLRKRHLDLALVAYADVHESDLDLYLFGGLGVDSVVLARRPPWASGIRNAVERALASARAGKVRANLQGLHDDASVRAVAWAVEYATQTPSVGKFAAAQGMSPAELNKSLDNAGLPTPGRVLLWGRLLQAAAYLNRDGRTVEDTALRLGYSTASALSRAMQRETGESPGEVSRRGGLPFVHARLFHGAHPPRRRGAVARVMTVALLALWQSACATLGAGGPSVDRNAIDAVLDAPPADQIHFGVLAVDVATGRTLYARDASRKFVPASNQKILVTSTALSMLGPDYRYDTSLWSNGAVKDGVLQGDLVLVGSGDPTLSRPFWPSGEAALAALADSLWATGIRHVAGALVVDATAWDSTTVGPTWEVEDLPYAYGSTGGVFAVDRGEVELRVMGGGAPGAPVAMEWSPLGTPDFVMSHLTTAPADSSTRVRSSYLPESRKLVLEGWVAVGHSDTLSFALRDPVRQATATMARILGTRGITVGAGAWVAWEHGTPLNAGCPAGSVTTCPGAHRIAGLWSPPMALIVEAILEPSQNWMTEQLIRTLGAEKGEGGSWRAGVDVVTGFLVDEVGVDSLDVSPRDGSGLSAYDLVTPRALVQVLRYMAAGPNAEVYRSALAEPGEEDSTLEGRLPELQGRVFAKTGTISNVNSLSGYLVRHDGREVVFSLLSNGSGLPSPQVRAVLDDVLKLLAGVTP